MVDLNMFTHAKESKTNSLFLDVIKMNRCGVCRSSQSLHLFGKYAIEGSKEAPLYHCAHCCVIYNAYIELNDIDYLNLESAWEKEKSTYEVPKELLEFNSVVKQHGAIFEWLSQHTRSTFRDQSLLEIGSGSGLRAAAALEFFSEVFVHDLVQSRLFETKAMLSPEDANRFRVIEDLSIGNLQVDWVVAWHVLEHLNQPAEIFKSISSALLKGGGLFLQVPMLTERHVSPGHIWFYSDYTLRKVLKESGFADVETFYDVEMCALTVLARV